MSKIKVTEIKGNLYRVIKITKFKHLKRLDNLTYSNGKRYREGHMLNELSKYRNGAIVGILFTNADKAVFYESIKHPKKYVTTVLKEKLETIEEIRVFVPFN